MPHLRVYRKLAYSDSEETLLITLKERFEECSWAYIEKEYNRQMSHPSRRRSSTALQNKYRQIMKLRSQDKNQTPVIQQRLDTIYEGETAGNTSSQSPTQVPAPKIRMQNESSTVGLSEKPDQERIKGDSELEDYDKTIAYLEGAGKTPIWLGGDDHEVDC